MKTLQLHNETFKKLLSSYQNWLEILGYAPTTVYNLPNHLKEFFYFLERNGHANLDRVTTQLVQQYYKELSERGNKRRGGGLSKAFLNKHQQALKKFLEYLKEHGASINFGIHLRQEKTRYISDRDILTQEEIKELFHASNYSHMTEFIRLRDKAILVLLYSCGLRRNEAMQLNCSDVLFDKSRIYVRKGKNYKERFVPVNKANMEILEEYLYNARVAYTQKHTSDAFLISLQHANRLGGMSLANRLDAIIEATENEDIIQKHITPHTLRHSIATHLMQNNVTIQMIGQFLGHSSLESTQIYTHLLQTTSNE